MVTPEAYIQKIRQLPPLMLKIAGSEEMTLATIALERRHRLTVEQRHALTQIHVSLIAQEYGPDDVLTHVIQDLKLPEAQAKELAIDFLGSLVLPMQWFVGDVEHLIRDLGGNPMPYVELAKSHFPEAFGLPPRTPFMEDQDEQVVPEGSTSIVQDFEERLQSFAGKAEVLLRLTGLSAQIEQARDAGKVSASECEQHLTTLDSISSAINTHDLNPFEVAALKRKLTRVVTAIQDAIA